MGNIPAGVFLIFLSLLSDGTMNDIKNVCVYSASSTKIDQSYFDAADRLGEVLAERGINLINGAGCLGLMRAVSDAALRAGGTVTGVIPHFMVEQGWHHKGLTRLIETETMHERKQLMADMSDGIIALPGGMRHAGGVAGDYYLEAAGTVSEADRDSEHQRFLSPATGDAGAGYRTEFHAPGAWGDLARGPDSRRGRKFIV